MIWLSWKTKLRSRIAPGGRRDPVFGLTSASCLVDLVRQACTGRAPGTRRGYVAPDLPAPARYTSYTRLRKGGAPVIPLSHARVVEALLIVRRGGDYGITLTEFSSRWPTATGKPRTELRGVGHVTGYLVRLGLLERSATRRQARFSLTPAGEKLLADAAPSQRRSS
jgi:hypothetical protein